MKRVDFFLFLAAVPAFLYELFFFTGHIPLQVAAENIIWIVIMVLGAVRGMLYMLDHPEKRQDRNSNWLFLSDEVSTFLAIILLFLWPLIWIVYGLWVVIRDGAQALARVTQHTNPPDSGDFLAGV